jgi:hypothetical protein
MEWYGSATDSPHSLVSAGHELSLAVNVPEDEYVRLNALAAAVMLAWASFAQAQTTPTPPPPADQGTPTEPAKAPPPPPPTAPSPPQYKFEMHGFTSGSIYVETGNLGPSEGQQALFANAPSGTQPNIARDKLILSGDVRQSRFNFSVAGPKAFGGATPKAVLEIDFFGGFGSGAFGSASLTPRLRFAYGELDWGSNRILFGQANDLIFAIAPTSLAHIAFPYGYGSGNIGWRRPAIFGFHTMGPKTGLKAEFAWEVGRGNWNDNAGIGNNTVVPAAGATAGGDVYGFSAATASAIPAVEARLSLLKGTMFNAFVTGHYHRIDRSGVNALSTPALSDLDVVAGNAGFKVSMMPITLAATGFVGKNLSPLIGNFLQFPVNGSKDVNAWGAWAQAGLNLTKELSAWYYIGTERPNENDARAAGFTRLGNMTSVGMLQYRDGGYAIGFEWIHFRTRTRTLPTGAGVTPVVTAADAAGLAGDQRGNQWMLSGNYFF